MARNTQLLSLIAKLRAETGRSQEISVGVDEFDNLKVTLDRIQETLYDDYEWPHLRVQRTVQLFAGQRYYDFPSDINFDRIEDIKLKYSNVYVPIKRGITLEDYSMYDSNASTPERSNPAVKWDVRNTGSSEQIEIWPIPVDNSQYLYFTGTKSLGRLTQDADTADLDDILIVMTAAAEMLERQKSPDAKSKRDAANLRLISLRKNSVKRRETIQMGLGRRHERHTNQVKIVVS